MKSFSQCKKLSLPVSLNLQATKDYVTVAVFKIKCSPIFPWQSDPNF